MCFLLATLFESLNTICHKAFITIIVGIKLDHEARKLQNPTGCRILATGLFGA